jgi:hypothetical protein
MRFGGRFGGVVAMAWAFGGALVAETACAAPAPEIPAAAAPSEATVKATAAPLKVGTDGAVDVVVDVIEGYHWNSEFPAKVEVGAATGRAASSLKVTKRTFAQLDGDFQSTERQAKVRIPLQLAAAGDAALPLEVKFSICNDRMCLRKTEKVTVALLAK